MAKSKLDHENEMNQSVFWKKGFIPVYFIGALLLFLLFHFYIGNDNPSIYLIIFFSIGLGIASIIHNNKKKNANIKDDIDENKM